MKKARQRKDLEAPVSVDFKPKKLESSAQPVLFSVFFADLVRLGKFKFWQHDELAAFIKHNGLSEKELPQTFESILRNY